MASMVHQAWRQLRRDGAVRLFEGTDGYADGEQRRDFVWVEDVVRVNLHFLERGGPSGIYNCGTGTAHSFNELVRATIRAAGFGRIEYVPMPESLRGKYQSYTQADPTNLRAAGCALAFTSLEEAVEVTVRSLAAAGRGGSVFGGEPSLTRSTGPGGNE
jgi:ADP-L-glycero-D-manno-heptose 6-epimerase